MTKELLQYVTEKTHEMTAARSCCAEIKAAAQDWLDAVGTEKESAQTAQYIKDLESVLLPVDGLLAFASSPAAVRHFGTERAAEILAHAKRLHAEGAEFCDCPACSAAAAILEKKAELL